MTAAVLVAMLFTGSGVRGVSQEQSAEFWALSTTWGRAPYRRCELRAGIFEKKGHVELRCTPNVSPPQKDITTRRELSNEETGVFLELAQGSDLYGGGHTGFGAAGHDVANELLDVMCCGRRDMIILVVSGNRTFDENAKRRQLLQQLRKWQAELMESARQAKLPPKGL